MERGETDSGVISETEAAALAAIYMDDFTVTHKKESVWAVAPTPEFRLSLGPRIQPPRLSLRLVFRCVRLIQLSMIH
jgi:hypothetical protein